MSDSSNFQDGRRNFSFDDQIETALEEHFARYAITNKDIWKNFPIYSRRVFLKRFLALYELFQKTINLPGDIVELGVYRGATLMALANFLEIRNMGDRQKRVIGFDNFKGFGKFDEKDGRPSENEDKVIGGFDSEDFESPLRDAIRIFDMDRFIPYKPRITLVKGDAEVTIPTFIEENPGIRISFLHFDVDLYEPTLIGLQTLWPLVVPGGVVAFDEYAIAPWEGESRAFDEFFSDKKVKLHRLEWSSNPGGYLIKGE